MSTDFARAPGLTVLAEGHWPLDGDTEPPPLTGFVASPFGPLVAAAADRCLGARFGEPPAPAGQAERTAIVLVSRLGDMATEAEVTGSVDNGTRASPLLFFQSVPSAVLGVVSAQWGLGGPVICTSPQGDALADGMDLSRLLLADGSADLVLVVTVELAVDGLGEDRAHALLLGPVSSIMAGAIRAQTAPDRVGGKPEYIQYERLPAALPGNHPDHESHLPRSTRQAPDPGGA